MLLNLPSAAQTSYRRATAYRETSLFLGLTGAALIVTHPIDIVAAGRPAWPALAVRVICGIALIIQALVLRKAGRGAVQLGAIVAIAIMTASYLALLALTGGAQSPSVSIVYVLAVAIPAVSLEVLPYGMLGSLVATAGTGLILAGSGASQATLLAFGYGSLGAIIAGFLLGRALLRARHAEERRHLEVADALAANERLVAELREAMANVRTLRGLLPVCAWCRRVRSDSGYWQAIEAYVTANSDARITHGVCPDCASRLEPGPSAAGDGPAAEG